MAAFHTALTIVLICAVSLVQGNDLVARYLASASIPCNVSIPESAAVFAVTWKHDGAVVVTYGGNIAHFQGDYKTTAAFDEVSYTLTLNELGFGDNGMYECTVTSSLGPSTSQNSLRVLASPKVETQAFDILDDGTGQVATLAECKATGASKPFSMKWVTDMNDEVVPDNFRVESQNPTFTNLFDAVLPLNIHPDPERNNGRTFTCVVEDAFGDVAPTDVVLTVSAPTTTPQTTTPQASPNVIEFPTTTDDAVVPMKIGSQSQFKCNIAGVPTPTVSWYRNGNKIVTDIGIVVLSVSIESFDDAATYTCRGTNNAGKISRMFSISVQGPPEMEIPLEFQNKSQEIMVNPTMSNIEISCEAEAKPKPTIRWAIEGLNESDFEVVEEMLGGIVRSVVNITSTGLDKKPTIAECTAENNLGENGRKFFIRYPVAEANTALVVGVVMAVIVLLAIVFFIVFFSLTRRQQKDVDVTKPTDSETGCVICTPGCFATSPCGNTASKDEIQEEVEGDQVKEVKEEGTSEEKQKLTEAEEKPAADNDTKSEEEADGKTQDKADGIDEPKTSKKKLKISLPTQCCRGNKQELKDESCDGENEEKASNDENGETPQEKSQQPTDKDSGKGDTLEKVVEEPVETK